MRSATAISPMGTSSRQTPNGVLPEDASRSASSDMPGGSPAGRPTRIGVPSRSASIPAPGFAACDVADGTSIPRSRAPSRTARAIGCSEPASAAAATATTSSAVAGGAGATSVSVITPSVIVPVLSSSAMSTSFARSKTSAPLNRTPSSAARPVPAMTATGVARPSAHGQAISSTATAWSTASPGVAPASATHPRAVSPARTSTAGTKTAEMRSASCCTGAFEPCARSSDRTMPASAVLAPTVVTNTTSLPLPLIDAPTTSSPGPTSTGTDSPVNNDRSTHEAPVFTTPSAGIFSPGRTSTRSPGTTRSIGVGVSRPSSRTVAVFAPRSSSTRAASPALARAVASSTLPTRISVMITAAVSK